jgi:hypothetical protein
MRVFRPLLTATVISMASFGLMSASKAAEPVGVLECNVSGGVGFIITSSKALACVFKPVGGRPEFYAGTIRRFGLDVGVTGPGKLLWTVVGIGTVRSHYPLSGEYAGATAEISAGPGLGANALIGGDKSIGLQPVSVGEQSGIDLAAGVAELTLEPAPQ